MKEPQDNLPFVCSDGGRSKAKNKWPKKDCVIRALGTFTKEPYDDLYLKARKAQRIFIPNLPLKKGIHPNVVDFVYGAYGLDYYPTWPRENLSFVDVWKITEKAIVLCAHSWDNYICNFHGQNIINVRAQTLKHLWCIRDNYVQGQFDPRTDSAWSRHVILGVYILEYPKAGRIL